MGRVEERQAVGHVRVAVITAHTVSLSSLAAACPRPAGTRVSAWRSSLTMTLRVIATISPKVASE